MKAIFRMLMGLAVRVPVLRTAVISSLFIKPFGRLNDEERTAPQTPGRDVFVFGQRKVRARLYGEGRPVFLVHGWGGQGQQMSAFVDGVVARGYQAVAIDLPAHGLSAGGTTTLLECRDALLAVRRHVGEPALAVAHSFGAAALALAADYGLGADALVFIAPLPSMAVGIAQFSRRSGIPRPVVDRALRHLERKQQVQGENLPLKELAKRLRMPLLIVHDCDDATISSTESAAVVEASRDARLVLTEGLGHRRILRSREVVDRCLGFAEQGFVPRPSALRLTSA